MRIAAFAVPLLLLVACERNGAETTPPYSTAPEESNDINVALMRATATGAGETVGEVRIRQTSAGAVFELNLQGLPPGAHGFHIHAEPSCAPAHAEGHAEAAGAAGGHWDPQNTGRHAGPQGDGHLGDLPRLEIGADGRPVQTTLAAPRIDDISALEGHALMVHDGGDNYADTPEPLGGGGERIACGVI